MNKTEWLEKAQELSQSKLEMEIKKVNPEAAVQEYIRPIAEGVYEAKLMLKAEAERAFKKAIEVLCQMSSSAISYNEAVLQLSNEFLSRHDPVERAKRAQVRAVAKVAQVEEEPVQSQFLTKALRYCVQTQ